MKGWHCIDPTKKFFLTLLLATLFLLCSGCTHANTALRVACSDDAAGLLIRYMAAENQQTVQPIDMGFQLFQDCCGSTAEMGLATGQFDVAILCPDVAQRLIADKHPFVLIGPVVFQGNVLISQSSTPPKTVGYMQLRDTQIPLVTDLYGKDVILKPMIPTALPYALERGAVEAIVTDVLSAMELKGTISPLPSTQPTAVLVAHKDIIRTERWQAFLDCYNQGIRDLSQPSILEKQLEVLLEKSDPAHAMQVWELSQICYHMYER